MQSTVDLNISFLHAAVEIRTGTFNAVRGQGMSARPSGRFPADLNKPLYSLVAGKPADVNHVLSDRSEYY